MWFENFNKSIILWMKAWMRLFLHCWKRPRRFLNVSVQQSNQIPSLFSWLDKSQLEKWFACIIPSWSCGSIDWFPYLYLSIFFLNMQFVQVSWSCLDWKRVGSTRGDYSWNGHRRKMPGWLTSSRSLGWSDGLQSPPSFPEGAESRYEHLKIIIFQNHLWLSACLTSFLASAFLSSAVSGGAISWIRT